MAIATSFSSTMLDKSVIQLTQKMPLLCVHTLDPQHWHLPPLVFQRGEGPLLVALGFVKYDATVLAVSVLDLLESRVGYGGAVRKESEEIVVTVSYEVGLDGHRQGELKLGEASQEGEWVTFPQSRHEGSEEAGDGESEGVGDLHTGDVLAGDHGPAVDGLVLAEQVGIISTSLYCGEPLKG